MIRRFGRLPLVALTLSLLVLAGCGGGGGSTSVSDGGATAASRQGATSRSKPQRPISGRRASAARERGRGDCRGLTPYEAASRFKRAAREAGARKRFLELVTEPAAPVAKSAGYPRLVASLYSITVPPAQQAEAAAGCAEELAADG